MNCKYTILKFYKKARRAITALPNTESGLLQKAVDAETNLIERPLPAIHIVEGNAIVSLVFSFSHSPH